MGVLSKLTSEEKSQVFEEARLAAETAIGGLSDQNSYQMAFSFLSNAPADTDYVNAENEYLKAWLYRSAQEKGISLDVSAGMDDEIVSQVMSYEPDSAKKEKPEKKKSKKKSSAKKEMDSAEAKPEEESSSETPKKETPAKESKGESSPETAPVAQADDIPETVPVEEADASASPSVPIDVVDVFDNPAWLPDNAYTSDLLKARDYGMTEEMFTQQTERADAMLASIGFEDRSDAERLEIYKQQKKAYKVAKKEQNPEKMAYYGSLLGKMDEIDMQDFDPETETEDDKLAEQASDEVLDQETEAEAGGTKNIGGNVLARAGLGLGGYALGSGIAGIFAKGDGFGSGVIRVGAGIGGAILMNVGAKPIMQLVADVLPEGKAKTWAQNVSNTLGSFESHTNDNSPVQAWLKQFGPDADTNTSARDNVSSARWQENVSAAENVSDVSAYTGSVYDPVDMIAYTGSSFGEGYEDSKYGRKMFKMGQQLVGSGALAECMKVGTDYQGAAVFSASGAMRAAETMFASEYVAEGKMTPALSASMNKYAQNLIHGMTEYSNGAMRSVIECYSDDPDMMDRSMMGVQNINQANAAAMMESLAYMDEKYGFMTDETREMMDSCTMPGVKSAGAYFDKFTELYDGKDLDGETPVRLTDKMSKMAQIVDKDDLHYITNEGQEYAVPEAKAQAQAQAKANAQGQPSAAVEPGARYKQAVSQLPDVVKNTEAVELTM